MRAKYKALLMPDRQHAARRFGQCDQLIGFVEIGRDGFFDQHMGAGIEKSAHDLRMGSGGRADADEVDLAQKIAPIGKRRNGMCGRHGMPRFETRIGDTHKLHTREPRIFRGMVTTKSPDADNAGAQGTRVTIGMGSQQNGNPRELPGLMSHSLARGATHKMFRLVTPPAAVRVPANKIPQEHR